MSFDYIEQIKSLINIIEKEESHTISEIASVIANTILNGNRIYMFGASHSGILSQESFYRAGGLVLINPIFPKEVGLDVSPISQSSKMEQLEGYGKVVGESIPFQAGDCLIIHAVSGRNSIGIDLALHAKSKSVTVVGITSVEYSKQSSSRHSSGKRLFEVSDIVLDNHGPIGDACVSLSSTDQKIGPSSTVIGVLMINTIWCETVKILEKHGVDPLPIFYSSNVDGGIEKNKKVMEIYQDRVNYKF